MKLELNALKEITSRCRYDMHEPDEQEISAHVTGFKLDNAMGNAIIPELLISGSHEIVVTIRDNSFNETFSINLATLIALARLAQL